MVAHTLYTRIHTYRFQDVRHIFKRHNHARPPWVPLDFNPHEFVVLCVYMYMYVYMYTCMYSFVCIHVPRPEGRCAREWSMYVCMYICMYVNAYDYARRVMCNFKWYSWLNTQMNGTCVYICVYARLAHAHTQAYMQTQTCLHFFLSKYKPSNIISAISMPFDDHCTYTHTHTWGAFVLESLV